MVSGFPQNCYRAICCSLDSGVLGQRIKRSITSENEMQRGGVTGDAVPSPYGAQSLTRESGCTRLPEGSYHNCSYVEEHRTQGVLLCSSGGRAINQILSALTYTEYNLK